MNVKVLLEILEGQGGCGVIRAVHLVRPGNPWMLMGDGVLIYPDYYGEVIGRTHAPENLVVDLRTINVVSGELHYREHVRWDPEVDCSYDELLSRCLEAGWKKDWEDDRT